MKKILCLTLTVILLLVPLFAYSAGENISVYVNGKAVNFDVPPTTINDRTMIPLRATFEMLGASVSWDDNTQTATGVKDGISVMLTIGSNTLYRNGNAVTLDVPPMLIADRTLVPVRAISEAFGCQVDWDENTQSVIISSTTINNNTSYSAPSVIEQKPMLTNYPVYLYDPVIPNFGDLFQTECSAFFDATNPSGGKIRSYSYTVDDISKVESYIDYLKQIGFDNVMPQNNALMFLNKNNTKVSVAIEMNDNTLQVIVLYIEDLYSVPTAPVKNNYTMYYEDALVPDFGKVYGMDYSSLMEKNDCSLYTYEINSYNFNPNLYKQALESFGFNYLTESRDGLIIYTKYDAGILVSFGYTNGNYQVFVTYDNPRNIITHY